MSHHPFFGCWRDAPPRALHWQKGGEGPMPISGSTHYAAAVEMLAGVSPDATCYAAAGLRATEATHGNPGKFAELVEGIRAHGWQGGRVSVGINRRGQLVLTDGMHRTAAAAALGLASIPITVVWRDESWWALLHGMKRLNGGAKLYHPIAHPDFGKWPAWRKDSPARVRIITELLSSHDARRVVDLGCHSGVIACGLARAGLQVLGLDVNPHAVEAATHLAAMAGIGADGRAVFRLSEAVPQLEATDAVVCLSALNHQWATGAAETTGAAILQAIGQAAGLLITDCPVPGDPVAGDSARWTDPGQVCGWIEGHLGGSARVAAGAGSELQRPLITWNR